MEKRKAAGKTLFISGSVTCGHPDTLYDQVSYGILDALLASDLCREMSPSAYRRTIVKEPEEYSYAKDE